MWYLQHCLSFTFLAYFGIFLDFKIRSETQSLCIFFSATGVVILAILVIVMICFRCRGNRTSSFYGRSRKGFHKLQDPSPHNTTSARSYHDDFDDVTDSEIDQEMGRLFGDFDMKKTNKSGRPQNGNTSNNHSTNQRAPNVRAYFDNEDETKLLSSEYKDDFSSESEEEFTLPSSNS